jgi:hypothetical protein
MSQNHKSDALWHYGDPGKAKSLVFPDLCPLSHVSILLVYLTARPTERRSNGWVPPWSSRFPIATLANMHAVPSI